MRSAAQQSREPGALKRNHMRVPGGLLQRLAPMIAHNDGFTMQLAHGILHAALGISFIFYHTMKWEQLGYGM